MDEVIRMEKPLDFVLKLPLQEMALRKVVIGLWNGNDILGAIQNFRKKSVKDWIETVENRVKRNVSKLVLPESLKMKIMPLVRPIGSDILKWKKFHEYYLRDPNEYLSIHVLKQLCWTCIGSIDYQKTAEELVRRKILDIEKRYRLASFYCLVDYIPLIWKEFDEECRAKFYGDDPFSILDMPLEYIWPYFLMGEESELDKITEGHSVIITKGMSFNQCVFEFSACIGNTAATKYFFQRLTNEEQASSLVTTACAVLESVGEKPWTLPPIFSKGKLSDVLSYLLSMMSPKQQLQVLTNDPCGLLYWFLEWPWHDLFLEIATIIWSYYYFLNDDLLTVVRNSGYYFPNLFQKFFTLSPRNFKEHFLFYEYSICYSFECCIFTEFFQSEDTETLKVVLTNICDWQRACLLSGRHFFDHFTGLIKKNKWRLVELCLQDVKPSYKKQIKGRFIEYLYEENLSNVLLRKWRRFFEVLDGGTTSAFNTRNSKYLTVNKARKTVTKKKRLP